MTLYEYRCWECGRIVEAFRTMDRREYAPDCPRSRNCGGVMDRVITAPHLHGSPNMPND